MYSYEEVLDQIENGRRFGNRPGVEITGIMLEQMGQPQNGMPFIHVAGTNGKGSVCAFLTSVFREAGLKVGTFISPHLIDFEERIMVDGRQISREDVTRIGNVLLEQEFGVTPTMFDYCVLMAVLYFKEQNCDLVIMETGLGGRLDSTNALGNPVVSVITRIGYDHMNILGNTIEEIAREKAGIIKAGVPVVIAPQESEALAVLQRAAAAKGVRARCVQEKDLQGAKALQPGLLGAYQRENAATAMCAAQVAWTGCRIEKEKMKTQTIPAYAKLNLTLDILGKRDDGYHELRMVMQTVSLCDDVTVTLTDGTGVVCRVAGAELPCDERNLAVKAANAFCEALGYHGGIDIALTKRIPSEAGMAGGSADAAAVLCVLLVLFLRTQLGLSLRATGDNRDMVSASSINPAFTTTVGLCLSNAVVALSGALIAQYQKFADNTLGTGMVVIGLASLIIGEVLFGRGGPHALAKGVLAATVGAVVYRIIVAAAIAVNIDAKNMKLVSALIVAAAISYPAIRDKVLFYRKRREANRNV